MAYMRYWEELRVPPACIECEDIFSSKMSVSCWLQCI